MAARRPPLRQRAEQPGRDAAAAAGRRRARRGDRGAGRARPPPRRPGRDLLAVPPAISPATRSPRIDWRQIGQVAAPSIVRETEWEAAQSVWLWRDASASMRYRSQRASCPSKRERAELLLAGAGGAAGARRRAGGAARRRRAAGDRPRRARRGSPMRCVGRQRTARRACRRVEPLPRHAHLVLIGDFLSPLRRDRTRPCARFAARGVQRPPAAGARSGRGGPAVRRPRPLRRHRGRRRGADQPRRERARRLSPAISRSIAQGLAAIAARRRLDVLRATAPTARRRPALLALLRGARRRRHRC